MNERTKKYLILAGKGLLLAIGGTALFMVISAMSGAYYQFLTSLAYSGQSVLTLVDKKSLPFLIVYTPVGFFGALGWFYQKHPSAFLVITLILSVPAATLTLHDHHQEQ
jgi:hypothetical protein